MSNVPQRPERQRSVDPHDFARRWSSTQAAAQVNAWPMASALDAAEVGDLARRFEAAIYVGMASAFRFARLEESEALRQVAAKAYALAKTAEEGGRDDELGRTPPAGASRTFPTQVEHLDEIATFHWSYDANNSAGGES